MDNSIQVGIWNKNIDFPLDEFVRDKNYRDEFLLWARTTKIPLHKDNFRIVLIGESVARGFLYDPYLTPAMILEKSLNVKIGKCNFEVIDLARTAIGIDQLIKLSEQSLLLEPDMIVMYAGNNWIRRPDELDKAEIAQILMNHKDTAQRIGKAREKQIEADVNQLMSVLSGISKSRNIPIMFMVPGVNLVDWSHNLGNEYFPLQTKNALEIYKIKDKIEENLDLNNYAQAKELIEQLISYEPNCAIGYELKGKLLLRENKYDDAVLQYTKAHDTDIYIPVSVPGCTTFCQNVIKSKANEFGFMVIDIPERFKESFPGDYAGNSMYIDYCHLSYIGMHFAMNYAANDILTYLKYEIFSQEPVFIDLSNKIISKIHFFAAIHCSHWGNQSYDLLYYHCKKAIDASQNISYYMEKYIKLVTTDVPWSLNKDYFDILEFGLTNQYSASLIQNDKFNKIDLILVNAMRDVMYEKNIDNRKNIYKLRLDEFGLQKNKYIDLLQPQFTNDSYIKYEIFRKLGYYNGVETAFIRLIDCVTTYNFIADTETDIELNIQIRASLGLGEAYTDIIVNNKPITSFELVPQWKKHTIIIQRDTLNKESVQHMRIEIRKKESSSINAQVIGLDTYNIWHVIKPLYAEIMLCQLSSKSTLSAT